MVGLTIDLLDEQMRPIPGAEYQTFNGRISEYELQPYHLLAYHGNWYVLARNVAKELITRGRPFEIKRFRPLST